MATVYGRAYLREIESNLVHGRVSYHAVTALDEYQREQASIRKDYAAPALGGVLEGILTAIGNSDTKIGGYRMTRLLDPVAAGEYVLPVENCFEWQDSGKVAVEGVVYEYSSKGAGSLHGITYLHNGVAVLGTKKAHQRQATVVDLGNPFSAIQKLRRAMLVEYAEEDDLNTIGRNLGVNRYPFPGDDEIFRAIVKSMAYNPRGTEYGIRLVLNAIFGEGHYGLFEDLINHPCTVYISLPVSELLTDQSIGHAYIETTESAILAATPPYRATVAAIPIHRGVASSVKWRGYDFLHSYAGSVRPSQVLTEDYDGDTGTALWSWAGANETTNVTPGSKYVTIKNLKSAPSNSSFYRMYGRSSYWGDEDAWAFTAMIYVPGGACVEASSQQMGFQICDGKKLVYCGFRDVTGDLTVALEDPFGGPTIFGSGLVLARDEWHEVTVEKKISHRGVAYQNYSPYNGKPNHQVVLTVDQKEIDRISYDLFYTASTYAYFTFGSYTSDPLTQDVNFRMKFLGFHYDPAQDMGGSTLTCDTGAGFGDLTSSSLFLSSDVGKEVIIQRSTLSVLNGLTGGNHNGRYVVGTYSGVTQIGITGIPIAGATVTNAPAKQVTVPWEYAFQFPDDLGKSLKFLDGPDTGETYMISALFDSQTGQDLSTFWNTKMRTKSNRCQLSGGGSISAGSVTVAVLPSFNGNSETGLEVIIGGRATVADYSGTPKVEVTGSLAPSVGYVINRSIEAKYSRVLTGQIEENSTATLAVTQDAPLEYNHYPFYVGDPFGLVRHYLKDLTAAGVIPEFTIED